MMECYTENIKFTIEDHFDEILISLHRSCHSYGIMINNGGMRKFHTNYQLKDIDYDIINGKGCLKITGVDEI